MACVKRSLPPIRGRAFYALRLRAGRLTGNRWRAAFNSWPARLPCARCAGRWPMRGPVAAGARAAARRSAGAARRSAGAARRLGMVAGSSAGRRHRLSSAAICPSYNSPVIRNAIPLCATARRPADRRIVYPARLSHSAARRPHSAACSLQQARQKRPPRARCRKPDCGNRIAECEMRGARGAAAARPLRLGPRAAACLLRPAIRARLVLGRERSLTLVSANGGRGAGGCGPRSNFGTQRRTCEGYFQVYVE
jgi:hypothetical protein